MMTITRTPKAIWASIVFLTCLCASLAGCTTAAWDNPSTDTPQMTLPPEPICDVFTTSQIAPLLPPGDYTHIDSYGLRYRPSSNTLRGGCILHANGIKDPALTLSARTTDGISDLATGCNGPRLDLHTTLGEIDLTISCRPDTTNNSGQAIALYFVGSFRGRFDTEPMTTEIEITITSREGRDPIADATQLMQATIDHMENTYLAALNSPELPLPFQSRTALTGLSQAMLGCAEDWFNTTATPDTIKTALATKTISHDTTTGKYTIPLSFDDFTQWALGRDPFPLWVIHGTTARGLTCPYTTPDEIVPDDPVKTQTTIDCFNTWLGRIHNSQQIIDSGLALGTLTHDPTTNHYHPNIYHEQYATWYHEHSIPWTEIRTEIMYGSGQCGYPE